MAATFIQRSFIIFDDQIKKLIHIVLYLDDLDVIELTPSDSIAGIADACPSPAQPEVADVTDGPLNHTYQPVVWHWFFLKEIDKTKRIWKPFSMLDSVALDETFQLRNFTFKQSR